MQNHIIVTMIDSRSSVFNIFLMISSIREFAGSLANSPIWVLFPHNSGNFTQGDLEELSNLKARLIPFDIQDDIRNFPFGTKVQAAAFAEELMLDQENLFIWLDCDTLVLNEPKEFLLPSTKILGYRPVHHKLIGSSWEDTLDPFWTQIYHECNTPSTKNFFMMTHVGEKIYPYFNAGTFVIRPELRILTKWLQVFLKCYRSSKFQAFYKEDNRYAIFMHQAIFTGVLLSSLKPAEMQEFSSKINYPLHLYNDIPTNLQPKTLNELITIRHENIIDNPGWQKGLPILEPLLSWINDHITFKSSPFG